MPERPTNVQFSGTRYIYMPFVLSLETLDHQFMICNCCVYVFCVQCACSVSLPQRDLYLARCPTINSNGQFDGINRTSLITQSSPGISLVVDGHSSSCSVCLGPVNEGYGDNGRCKHCFIKFGDHRRFGVASMAFFWTTDVFKGSQGAHSTSVWMSNGCLMEKEQRSVHVVCEK